MKKKNEVLEVSASDLVGYLNCRHLSDLDRAVAERVLAKPVVWDPLLQLLWERGSIHETNYVDHLIAAGFDVVRIEGIDITDDAVTQTLSAMKDGTSVIAQGALRYDGWSGRADILRRVETPSALGQWSYEAIDTKLARETRAGAVLQLCVYSDLLSQVQGMSPEHMYIVAPWSNFEARVFRYADYAAYYRRVKRGLEQSLRSENVEENYPDPKEHCEICQWRVTCEERRRHDDHLCLVAGISKIQINELKERGITAVQGLAAMSLPLNWKPQRGSAASYIRIREQARIQVEGREAGEGKFEILPVEIGFGFTCLPEPSSGDIYLDLEGDPFAGEHGIEYLFGYQFIDDCGKPTYRGDWALSREEEKHAFEVFVDFVMTRRKAFPDLHIYHYAPYEPAALKRLMGRYATRGEEIDQMLRAGLFVDLYSVVRHGVRASVESYSIKRLEPFYEFKRTVPLTQANSALAKLQASLELEDVPSIAEDVRAAVLGYNHDDCASTASLHHWLESLRAELLASGTEVPRPIADDSGEANEKVTAWLIKINALVAKLTEGIPIDPSERNEEQQACWILANILDWHRREEKAVWWEYFRLAALSEDELLDERAGLSGLVFDGAAGGTARAPIHRYKFRPQDTDIRGDEDLRSLGGAKFGTVHKISLETLTIEIKKRQDTADIHPEAVFGHKFVGAQVMADALVRIGEHVAARGVRGDGPYRAARELLLREPPEVGGQAIRRDDETALEAAVRLTAHLTGSVLPIQGPPGTGKTHTAARMICELARQGKKIGITANSHKVIRNLIDTTIKVADELGINLSCCHKADEIEEPQNRLTFAKGNEDLVQAIVNEGKVGGGTAWFWSRPEAFEIVDVLFVDEAAQMSLANVLAVSQAARSIVLIGDPQQLDQPTKGSHPDGCDVSSLNHILSGEQTITSDKGLFLDETWRLHPDICAFTSELFYANKLRAKDGLSKQVIKSTGPISGSGLRYFPVEHAGNQTCSLEEAQVIATLVKGILDSGATWIDRDGKERSVTMKDILIIAPYNAQVFEIQRHLSGARIGTVDKFQGQEAPIAIYSMATSSYADAPRGMEFLYSLNRFNVATSRAKCVSILVSSPEIFEAECATPRQMQLANAFCRYLEMAGAR